METALYIGLDCSTTAAKAVAWTPSGQAVAAGRAPIACSSPQPGWAEQDPEDWWRASAEALAQCIGALPSARRVAAVGVACQRETFALLDAQDRPVRPAILWYDSRAEAEVRALQRRLGRQAYHRLTGKHLDITSVAAKLRWLGRHEPRCLAASPRLADVPAYLALRLSGRLATPWSGIDTAGLVDLQRRDWAHPVLEAAGLEPRRLPELVPPATRVGRVTAPASRQTGVPVGTPVVAAGGDGHCFALGAATCHPRAATFTIGTSAVLGLNVERPVLSGACRTLLACSPDQYLLEGVIQCGSATVAWLEDVFAASPGGRTRGREPRGNGPDPAAAVPPGAEGLLVLPHWRGARAPHNDALARGVAVGWTDRHTLAHFRRAILEGVALEMAALLERAAAESATAPEALVLGGGGAANDTWCGIIADVTGLPCLRPDTVELTSLGAALCALAWAQGNASPLGAAGGMTLPARTFLPAPARQKVYADLRPVFARLYPATRGLSHALASLAGPAAAQ